MKSLLISQVKNMVVLDSGKTQEILMTYCRDRQLEAIKELESYPYIQYDFIREMVDEESFSLLTNEVKLIYLENMCRIDRYRVATKIRSCDFPLEESLKICQKYNIIEAVIAVNEKMGRMSTAMDLFLDRFDGSGYLKKIKPSKLKKDLAIFDPLLRKVYEMSSETARQSLLTKALERLSLAIPYGVKPKVRSVIVEFMMDILLHKLEGPNFTYNQETFDRVNALMSKVVYNLTFPDLQSFLQGSFGRITLNKQIWEEYEALDLVDGFKYDEEAEKDKKIGTKMQTACCKCHRQFNHTLDQIIIYTCGHGFHLNCVNSHKCEYCQLLASGEGLILMQEKADLDLLDLSTLLQWNTELVSDSMRATVGLTSELTSKTGDLLKFLYDGTLSAVQAGAGAVMGEELRDDLQEEKRETLYKKLLQQRERLERLEQLDEGRPKKLSDLMEPDVYTHRMVQKMNFVNEQFEEAFKDLTEEVIDFEESAQEDYSISKLKFVLN